MDCNLKNVFQHTADQVQAIQNGLGDACPSIVWAYTNQKYLIIPGTALNNRPLRGGGISYLYDFQCDLIVSQFLNAQIPDVKTLVQKMMNSTFVYLGDNYKFWNVHILAGATMIRAQSNAQNQKA